MLLVGATQTFIRRPFIIRGIVQGIYSAVFSLVLIGGIIYFAQHELPELIDFQDIQLFISLIVIVVLTGILISWLSTYFALRKFLNMKTDDLYY